MADRLTLQTLLEEILGSRNVYYQPPESIKMNYPAIVYGLDNIQNPHASNAPYLSYRRYQVTIIDKNPDSKIVDKVLKIPTCRFDRSYTGDNLNHWSCSLYF